jgi:hypothetical protein
MAERLGFRHQPVVVEHRVDDAPFQAARCGQCLAAEEQLARAQRADPARHEVRGTRIRRQADRRVAGAQLHRCGRIRIVAAERQADARPADRAVQRGDHRHRQLGELKDRRVQHAQDAIDQRGQRRGVGREFGDVAAGAEHRAAGREQHHARRIGRQLGHGAGEGQGGRLGQRVVLRRPIDDDAADAVLVGLPGDALVAALRGGPSCRSHRCLRGAVGPLARLHRFVVPRC